MMVSMEEWYNNEKVKEILPYFTKFRESMIISKADTKFSMRYLNLLNTDSFKYMSMSTKFLEDARKYSLYSSLARFRGGFPVYGFFGEKRRQMVKDVNTGDNYAKAILETDFAIDIDAPDHNYTDDAYFSANQIKKMFDSLDVPYSLRFSGCGFHFVIPGQYFRHSRPFDGYIENNIYEVYRAIADCLHNEFSEFIDTSIYDMKRVLKVPYSLAVYNDVIYVCWQFTSDEEFDDFRLEDMTPENRWKELNTSVPGVHIFNPNGSIQRLLSRYGVKL